MSILQNTSDSDKLYDELDGLIYTTQQEALKSLRQAGVLLYWNIGARINQFLPNLTHREKYGHNLVDVVADRLQIKYGKGFGRRVIYRTMQFAKTFFDKNIVLLLSEQLKWSHFVALLNIDDSLKREFYAEMTRIERWSVRDLKEKINKMMYERTALAKKPESLIQEELAKLRHTSALKPDFIIQDPVFFEFLENKTINNEADFENAIIADIEQFLLNMGVGFTFVERQKVIEVDGDYFKIDLLMFNRRLKNLICIELKMGALKPKDKGQMELYLRWLEKYEKQPDENPPLGIILCSEKSQERVELLALDRGNIRVSQFLTQLPPKEILAERLHQAIERARENYQSDRDEDN